VRVRRRRRCFGRSPLKPKGIWTPYTLTGVGLDVVLDIEEHYAPLQA